jgi:hypothetical protein
MAQARRPLSPASKQHICTLHATSYTHAYRLTDLPHYLLYVTRTQVPATAHSADTEQDLQSSGLGYV